MSDQELLKLYKKHFNYDPNSGNIYWKVHRSWNARVGDIAGSIDGSGYVSIGLVGKLHKGHRIAFLMSHGHLPEFIDHENADRLDNRICNLRQCTKAQNSQNSKMPSRNKSGYKGVCFHKRQKKWTAAITANGVRKHIGSFDSKEDAKKAYNSYAIDLHKEFASL